MQCVILEVSAPDVLWNYCTASVAAFIACNSQIHHNKQNCSSVSWDFLSVLAEQKDGDISLRALELEPSEAVFMCHMLCVPSALCQGWHKPICCSVYLVLHTALCSREEGKALGQLLSSPGRGIMRGSRASTGAGAAAHLSAAHISDNLRNKALPTPLPC